MEENLGFGKKKSGPATDTKTCSSFLLPKPGLGRTLIAIQ